MKFKLLLLMVIFGISHLASKAQPGVLDFVLKSSTGNTQETVTVKNQFGDIVVVSIFDDKNQIVYTSKYSSKLTDKAYYRLPKGIYKVIIMNANGNKRPLSYQINLQ